jgi:hypothetical protein
MIAAPSIIVTIAAQITDLTTSRFITILLTLSGPTQPVSQLSGCAGKFPLLYENKILVEETAFFDLFILITGS